jgi:hypothetical protein
MKSKLISFDILVVVTMNEFQAKSINAEDPQALTRTLGMGQVRIQNFMDFRDATLMQDGTYQFLYIKNSYRHTLKYDPTVGKKEMRPLFLLDVRTVKIEELEEEWCCGEFYYLVESQQNIKVIRGM